MNKKLRISLLVVFCVAAQCNGQGTLHISFDGPPFIAPGTAIEVTSYSESGMSFRPLPGSFGFSRWGAATDPRDPDDGTTYLRAAVGDSLIFGFANGSAFDLSSVDLAEYSTVVPNAVTVQFIGYHMDGSTVTSSFTTDGIIDGTGPLPDFQTFNFDSKDWSGLTRVEIPSSGWSLDNLVVSVPEPTIGALLLVALAVGYGVSKRRMRPSI
jgi:hypothetical protein